MVPRQPLKTNLEGEGEVVNCVAGVGSVAWNLVRAFDNPGLDGVSQSPATAVACAYDIGCVTDGRAAAGMGLQGRMRVVVGSICIIKSVLVAVVVCEAVSMVVTLVCMAALVVTGVV